MGPFTRILAALFLAALACLPARAETLTIFAAASLKESLDAVARAFEAASGHAVRVSYGASSALARQIEAGAPAQVFISADEEWMAYVAQRNLVHAQPVNLLTNELVLIAPGPGVPRLRIVPSFPIAEALGAGRLAIADPGAVPAGKYARAALESLGVWAQVRERLAPAENVRATLALVARGETPLGIVYRTDALAEPRVAIVDAFPATSHRPIVYPMAVMRGAPSAAGAFATFAASPAARTIWRFHGFGVPR